MSSKSVDVPLVSHPAGIGLELIDSAELATRWQVPESWVRNHARVRTPKHERIPCIRLGRYVRFRWGSTELESWLAAHMETV